MATPPRGKKGTEGGIMCVRVSMVMVNFVTLLAGVATIAVGALLFFANHVEEMDRKSPLVGITEDRTLPLPEGRKEFIGLSIILMSLGTLIAFISFLGCFGSCIRGKCLLATYLLFVGIALVLQLLVSVFAIVYRQPISGTLRSELLDYVKREYRENTDMSKTWDLAQQTFACCGVDGFSDWFNIDAWPNEMKVPGSCCLEARNATGCGTLVDPNKWHKAGCLTTVQFTLMEQLHYLATIIVALVFLQLYGIIGSTILFYQAKERELEKEETPPKKFTSYSYELANRR